MNYETLHKSFKNPWQFALWVDHIDAHETFTKIFQDNEVIFNMLFANAFITDVSCSHSEVKSLCVINTAMTRAWETRVEWLTDWLTDRVTDYLTDWLNILLVSWLTETINWQTRIFAKVALLRISYFIGNHGHRWRKFNTSICKQRQNGSPSIGVSNPELAPWQLSKEPLVRRYCPAAGGLKLELSDNGGGVCFSGEAHGRTKRGSEKSTKLEQSSQKSAKSEDCPLMADDRWTF